MNNIVMKGIERATDTYAVSIVVDSDDRDVLDVITPPEGVSIDIIECGKGLYVTFRGKAELVMETEQMLYDLFALAHTHGMPCNSMAEAEV